jgi:O-methyltransferase involved in polyketide biosynthesis
LRDFTTISPSARNILMVRSQTGLPYAREAAVRLYGETEVNKVADDIAANPDAYKRMRHFDIRARSIDQALAARGATCVLELAGGLSFRGLALCQRGDVTYVDTDLPDMIATKRELVAALCPSVPPGYRLEALDATDATAMTALVDSLPAGPLTIVNEGLLVYLGEAEKTALCATILGVLRARGGAWVTADIYVRTEQTMYRDAATREFLAKHDVDANKFADYAAAEAFFTARGFAIVHRAPSSRDPNHPRETWVLEPAR